ncbi:MAG: prenyltransferase/squalene oxidase repeat-containing protein [Planctomycetaceae bacterium]
MVIAGLFAGIAAGAVHAADNVGPDKKVLEETRKKAVDFLKSSQSDDGSWTSPTIPGISALVVTSLLNNGVPADDPSVAKGLAHLKTFIQPDGGIYYAKSGHRNYECCIALMAFQAANAKGEYQEIIKNADKFLRDLQWDEGENLKSSDTAYGGAGYGRNRRPDLSNTQFLIEALKAAGAKEDDPALQKALIFVSRSQNLESEHNTTEFAAKINDGGFYYTPAAGGSSQAGAESNGGLRSYGSMTYAGLKSMIYAGLTTKDPRAKAAFDWIQKFYTVKENPGMGQLGLYYYYHTFAKALAVMNIDTIQDAKGGKHDWRKELVEEIASKQLANGSFTNPAERWQEGDPNLVTAYVLMTLANCEPKPAAEASR